MKKVVIGSICGILLFTLSACGSDQYEQAMEKGNSALEKKEYELAMSHYKNASELDTKMSEPNTKLEEAKNAYFDALYEKGLEALDKKAFTEAKELLVKAYELDEVKQEDILDKKLKAEDLEKKQKQLNDYAKWVAKAAKINQQLSTEWRNASSNLSIGVITVPEFKEKMQLMLTSYQDLLTSAEEEILSISGELSVVHTNYLDKLQNNYEQNRLVILETGKEEVSIESILSKGKVLDEIQQQQALHIQALKSYAQTQEIVFKEN